MPAKWQYLPLNQQSYLLCGLPNMTGKLKQAEPFQWQLRVRVRLRGHQGGLTHFPPPHTAVCPVVGTEQPPVHMPTSSSVSEPPPPSPGLLTAP